MNDIRTELAKVLYIHPISDRAGINAPQISDVCESAADAIIARFPWLADEPGLEWGIKRTRGMVGTVIPANNRAEAGSLSSYNGFPVVARAVYRSEWEEQQ